MFLRGPKCSFSTPLTICIRECLNYDMISRRACLPQFHSMFIFNTSWVWFPVCNITYSIFKYSGFGSGSGPVVSYLSRTLRSSDFEIGLRRLGEWAFLFFSSLFSLKLYTLFFLLILRFYWGFYPFIYWFIYFYFCFWILILHQIVLMLRLREGFLHLSGTGWDRIGWDGMGWDGRG